MRLNSKSYLLRFRLLIGFAFLPTHRVLNDDLYELLCQSYRAFRLRFIVKARRVGRSVQRFGQVDQLFDHFLCGNGAVVVGVERLFELFAEELRLDEVVLGSEL